MQFPSLELLGQSLLSGLFIGGLYGLLGLGLSLSWGMLRQINLAHFALSFLGAYLTYQLSSSFGVDPVSYTTLTLPMNNEFEIPVDAGLLQNKIQKYNVK